jgi:ATP-dependent RNA helicase DeaD
MYKQMRDHAPLHVAGLYCAQEILILTVIETVASDGRTSSFGGLPVGEPIARALRGMGYVTPTPIQEQAIPPLRERRDVLGQAQTGTGKTAGFGVPLIEATDSKLRTVQAIVLVPTRELCIQVAEELTKLGAFAQVRVAAVYGGVGFGKQLDALRAGTQVIVGTPGRVEDLLARGNLRLEGVKYAVLDEADRMLDVGFLPAIERILSRTPKTRQTALFSATLPTEVHGLARRQMNDPVTISVTPEKPTVDAIEQRFEQVDDGDKLAALSRYLDDPQCFLALIFRRTTYKADRLARDLSRRGYKVGTLHGRRSQPQREKVLSDLKNLKIQALIATDIAARGLDISGLTHVFNYDLPDTPETYVHRIGRTGRAGEVGTAVTLVGPDDEDALKALKTYLARREKGDQSRGGVEPRPQNRPQRNMRSSFGPRPAASSMGERSSGASRNRVRRRRSNRAPDMERRSA